MAAIGLSAPVTIGDDGSLSIAQQFCEYGIPIVGVPKTIDNDLEGTMWTFGFDSAVAGATDAIDRLHTTAESHRRVMVFEEMGRYAGWIGLYAGIAGGTDAILVPEIPSTYESVAIKIKEREDLSKHFTIVVAAEGRKSTPFDRLCEWELTRRRATRAYIAAQTMSKSLAIPAIGASMRRQFTSRVVVAGLLAASRSCRFCIGEITFLTSDFAGRLLSD